MIPSPNGPPTALLALEKNWEGPLASNGAVDGTLASWQRLETEAPALQGNWRWQQALFRAYYDAYTRHRLLRETDDRQPGQRSPARGAVGRRDCGRQRGPAPFWPRPTRQARTSAWRTRIVDLGAALFASIGMQLDTPTYKASGTERGAVLDFLALSAERSLVDRGRSGARR